MVKRRRKKKRGTQAKPGKSQTNHSHKSADTDAVGRVVITHSTYIPGLIDRLEKLAQVPGIQTITPAVISRVKSHSPQFRLKISVPTMGGFKLIARRAKSAQEVFVVTSLSREALEGEIKQLG